MKKILYFVCIYYTVSSTQHLDVPFARKGYVTAPAIILHLWKQAHNPALFTHTWTDILVWYEHIYATLSTLTAVRMFACHCRQLHQHFFAHLFFDTVHNQCVWVDTSMRLSYDHSLIPLNLYWQRLYYYEYARWYAMYFDCVVQLFLASLCSPQHEEKLSDIYRNAAHIYYMELQEIMLVLEKTPYEKRYGRQLHRYQELLSLITHTHD